MTSLQTPSTRRPAAAPAGEATRSGPGTRQPRRSLALVAATGGVVAAGLTVAVALVLGVVGWYLADGGAHGEPRDALRVGALGWLTAHGSGVVVQGAALTAVPLGLTLLVVAAVWRVGLRVGDAVSGHGPDATTILDGDRDWTVPVATALFTAGYLVVALGVLALASTPQTTPSAGRVALWSVVLCLLVGGPAVAVGSGRAAIWAASLPSTLRVAARVTRRIVLLWALAGLVALVLSLALDLSTAANVMSQLHADAGAAASIVGLSLLVLPNAVVLSGAYLLGPGFTVGVGTVVSPSAVALGPLPEFPLLAALPDQGPVPSWTAWLVALAPLVAVLGAVLVQRAHPTLRWDEGAVRGLAGGVGAGLVFGLLSAAAGGAVGPGRLHHVGPLVSQVLVHGVTSFGLGGLVGGLLVTWWQRHRAPVVVTLDD